jgi:hypothetical protein
MKGTLSRISNIYVSVKRQFGFGVSVIENITSIHEEQAVRLWKNLVKILDS